MRKILTMAAACGVLFAACGGVDRDGTRDEIIKSVEAAGGTVDGDCVDDVLDKYSDDQLETIDDQMKDGGSEMTDEATELFTQLNECVSIGS